MFSKFLAAAALTVVSAADVPLFSSNDDYDEINLNIRMLSNGTAPVATNISVTTKMSGDFGVNSSSELAPGGSSYSSFNTGMCSYLQGLDGNATACVVTAVADARRRLSETAEKRRLATLTISVTSAMTYPSVASAAVGTATVNTKSALGDPAADITTALTQAGMTVTGVTGVSTAAAPPVTPGTPAAAAAPAAAAPSPSPSSNAAKVAVSTLAALSAFVASLL